MLEQQEVIKHSYIADAVSNTVKQYINTMGEEKIINLYDMVLEQVEGALFEAVMSHFHCNQVRAAKALSLSRGTLRTKLKHYFGEKYCGERAK